MSKSKLIKELEEELKVYEATLSDSRREDLPYEGGLCRTLDITCTRLNLPKVKFSQFTFQNAVNSGYLNLQNLASRMEEYNLDYEELKGQKQSSYYWWGSYSWEYTERLGFLLWMICQVRTMLSLPVLTLKERILLLESYMIPLYTGRYHKNPRLEKIKLGWVTPPVGLCMALSYTKMSLTKLQMVTSQEEDVLLAKLVSLKQLPEMDLVYCGLKHPLLAKLFGGKRLNSTGQYWWNRKAKARLYYMKALLLWFKIQLFFNKLFKVKTNN